MRHAPTTRHGFTGRAGLSLLVALLIVGSWLLAVGPAAASPAAVTGQLAMRERVILSPDAVAVVTLVDQDAGPDAGAIISEQRIDGVTLPTEFAVTYDTDQIDPTHAYALFASVIDGTSAYETVEAVPVITGGPTSDVVLTLVPQPTGSESVTGTIVRSDKRALTADAIAVAALINADTGTLIARQVIPSPTQSPIPFSIPFLSDVIDPTATYVVRAAIDDVDADWQSEQGVPAILGGTIVPDIEVPVTLVTAPSPSPSLAPSESPSASASVAPSPTGTPTASPTPTSSPTSTPTVSASPTPEPSESVSPSPTEAPTKGVIEGTLTYREGHKLGPEAKAIVVLADVSTGADLGTVVASTSFTPTGPPAPYKLSYQFSDVNGKDTYRLFAGIVDGDLAWVTPIGVTVPVPEPSLTGIELPLAFRPDLLKGAVTGLITGDGLDVTDPGSAATVMVVRADTGETVGFQYLSSLTEVPIPFSAPYDPTSLTPGADYELFAWIYDGSTEWENQEGVPVITNGNPTSDVSVLVTQEPTPSPSPTASPSASPSPGAVPSPSAEPTPESGGGLQPGLILIVLLVLSGGAIVAFAVSQNRP